MNHAICVQELHKKYGSHHVLKGISFSVKQGEIFALLGINGAGKTTTLECLEGIGEFQQKKYRELSTGQKRRLHLAIAMLGNPDIVFLDEPTAGLDVEGRFSLHNEIKNIQSQGKTIIMASHDMAEVEELCDRIAILKEGTIAFLGTSLELTQTYQEGLRIQILFSAPFVKKQLTHCTFVGTEQGYQIFDTPNLTDGLLELSTQTKQQSLKIRDIQIERASLEQRFIEISH